MSYSLFETEDFLSDCRFILWVTEGKDDAFWQSFLQENPAKAKAIARAESLIKAASTLPRIELAPELQKEMWLQIKQNIAGHKTPVSYANHYFRKAAWVAAASFLLVAGFIWWWNSRPASLHTTYTSAIQETPASELSEFTNLTTRALPIDLPDGSSVTLQPKSRIYFNKNNFDKEQREVFLLGEGFFEVVKNPAKPFKVYANELVARVLGTSFAVKAYPEDGNVEVRVKTGRVSVYANKAEQDSKAPQQEFVLQPNQEISLNRHELTLSSIRKNSNEKLFSANTISFDYDESPVTQILEDIKSTYGIDVVYDKSILSKCTITASLGGEPLYEKIRLICKGLDASYKLEGNSIIIQSTGCE